MDERTIEQTMIERGVARARSQYEAAASRGAYSETQAGVELIKRAVMPFAEAIKGWLDEAQAGKPGRNAVASTLVADMDPMLIAYVASKVILDNAMIRATLNSCAIAIGTALEDELRLAAYEEKAPGLFATVKRRVDQNRRGRRNARTVFIYSANKFEIELPTWTKTNKMKLGVKLVDLFVQSVGAAKVIHTVSGLHKTIVIVAPTDYAEEWLRDRQAKAEVMRPFFLPTVEPPKAWETPEDGGYHFLVRQTPLVKRAYKKQMAALADADLHVVYTGLNALQATPWRINSPVLEVMRKVWDNDLQIAIPNRDDQPVPPVPEDFDDPEVRKEWKMNARRIHEANASSRGRRLAIARLISTAEELADLSEIYFPHQLDFRGRAYAMPTLLNPQGQDEARALLTFARGKPIDNPRAAGWLMIHGANLFGYDKVSFEDRIQWVEDHKEDILRSAEDPLGHTWWAEADKPWCFLAWCYEYKGLHDEGYGYVSSLPISVDGSCNGLQHFSAMLRDPVGGAAVNLVPSDKPQDIYQQVADRTLARLQEDLTDPEKGWIASAWLQFGIDRKITKRPVMVLPYGGTYSSCLQYVREAVIEKINAKGADPFGVELGKATAYLASVVWRSIGDVVVAAKAAMEWLQQCARVVAKANLPLIWTTPSGFKAYQFYSETESKKVKTYLNGSVVVLSEIRDTDKVNPRRQSQGISPNFVHSMDASAMMLTIELAMTNGVQDFAMIHDSYGTLAADMDMLSVCLREAFIAMYQEHNVLEEFRTEIAEALTSAGFVGLVRDLPSVPTFGSLDLDQIRDADFFFA